MFMRKNCGFNNCYLVGHTLAFELISFPHSLHLIKAI